METHHLIVVSKAFNNPTINYKLHVNAGVGSLTLEMDLDEFIDSVVAASSHPWKMMTRSALKAALMDAKEQVIQEMKDQSIHSPPPIK